LFVWLNIDPTFMNVGHSPYFADFIWQFLILVD